jgi:hypothetical protein
MRFPRIWAVLHRRFPGEHSSFSQVRCVCHSATPAWLPNRLPIIGQVCPDLHVRFLISRRSCGGHLQAAFLRPLSFDFFFFLGRMTLLAAASSEILMCAASISPSSRHWSAIFGGLVGAGAFDETHTDVCSRFLSPLRRPISPSAARSALLQPIYRMGRTGFLRDAPPLTNSAAPIGRTPCETTGVRGGVDNRAWLGLCRGSSAPTGALHPCAPANEGKERSCSRFRSW